MVMRKHDFIVCTCQPSVDIVTDMSSLFLSPEPTIICFIMWRKKPYALNKIHELSILAERLKDSELKPDMDWVLRTGKTKLKTKG